MQMWVLSAHKLTIRKETHSLILYLLIIEDASGNLILGDNKTRPNIGPRNRGGFRSDSHDTGIKHNNSDPSLVENGQANDSGIDTAVSTNLVEGNPFDNTIVLHIRFLSIF